MLKHTFDCDKIIQTEKKKWITKQDFYMILGIVMIALLFLFGFHIFGKDGSYAVVSYDGTTIAEIPLTDMEERYYLITESESETDKIAFLELTEQPQMQADIQTDMQTDRKEYNVFVCKDGKVQMLQSSCPDQICVHHTEIAKTGESIICLPHKLVIEISGAEENELDGVVY